MPGASCGPRESASLATYFGHTPGGTRGRGSGPHNTLIGSCTGARPAGERSENVDPTSVDVDAAVGLAPSPEEPARVAGAGAGPELDPGNAVDNEAMVVPMSSEREVVAKSNCPSRYAFAAAACPAASSGGGGGGAEDMVRGRGGHSVVARTYACSQSPWFLAKTFGCEGRDGRDFFPLERPIADTHEPTEGGVRRYDVPEERWGAEGWGRRRYFTTFKSSVDKNFPISSGHEDRAS